MQFQIGIEFYDKPSYEVKLITSIWLNMKTDKNLRLQSS